MRNDPSFRTMMEASERLPLVTAGCLPPSDSSVLFVLCSYPRDSLPRDAGLLVRSTLTLVDVLTRGRLRAHRTLYRDHYANPRSLAYLVGLALRLQRQMNLRRPGDLTIDRGFAVDADGLADRLSRVEVADLRDPCQPSFVRDAEGGRYDAVVLIWPDALGLGWESLQRRIMCLPTVIAMNGRRRVFSLDGSTRRALGLRRYFAYTRLAELFFAMCVYPVAGVCALVDAVRRP